MVQAVGSEVLQGALLPNRSGDPWDVVADLVGVAAGLAVGGAWAGRVRGAGPGSAAAGSLPG